LRKPSSVHGLDSVHIAAQRLVISILAEVDTAVDVRDKFGTITVSSAKDLGRLFVTYHWQLTGLVEAEVFETANGLN
jgi:hypothetical protein